MAQGPYVIPRIRYDALSVVTNTSPVGAFRGAGRPEAAALLERILDVAADELGLAPEEIRRRNFVPAGRVPVGDLRRPRRTTPATTTSPLTEALRLADVDGARGRAGAPSASPGDPRQLGIGIASYVEITGFGGSEMGYVRDPRRRLGDGPRRHLGPRPGPRDGVLDDRLGAARASTLDRIRYEQADTAIVPTRRRHRRRPLAADGRAGGRPGRDGAARDGRDGWPPSCSRRRPTTSSWATSGFAVRGVPDDGRGLGRPRAPGRRAGRATRGDRRLRAGARDVPVRQPRRDRRGRHRDRAGHAAAPRRRRRLRPGRQPAAGRRASSTAARSRASARRSGRSSSTTPRARR